MSDESGLVEFLRARLDEDERVAQAAASYDDGAERDVQGRPGTWALLADQEFFGPGHPGGVIAPRIGYANSAALGQHIARQDPARVLAEVAAKRRMLLDADSFCTEYDNDMDDDNSAAQRAYCWRESLYRDLAAPHFAHPDYKPAWAPTG